MTTAQDYPQLDSLIGGWFHQDFDLEGGTLEEIVGAYKKVHTPLDWEKAKAEIMRFIETRNDAQVKDDFVRLFQPGVDAEAWGMSTREWLLRIAQLLQ